VKNLEIIGSEHFIILGSIIVRNTSFFDGREHCPRYHEIYCIFQNEDYPSDEKEIDVYHNIRRSNIHTLVAHPMLFPYNDVALWCFTHI